MAVILKRMVRNQRSLKSEMTLSGTSEVQEGNFARATGTVRRDALPGSIAMQRPVSPELKVYTISDREALSELVADLRLDSTLAGNLRQLLGYQTVGPGRQARQMAGNWQRLELVRWLKHLESGKLVPVVGSNARSAFSNVAVHRLKTRADMNF